jgi:DNA-binding MarR family transcriptional regulator
MSNIATATSPPPHADRTLSSVPRGEGVQSVTETFVDLQRTVRRSKARLLAAAGNDVESATQMLLRTVESEGPMRASALAAHVQSDLSTVSRQVAGLVTRGLLERRADQCDGRASLLVVTEAGRSVIAEHDQGRREFFNEVLTDWSIEEMRTFAQQLARFTTAYDHTHAAWMSERAGRTAGAPHSGIASTHRTDLEEGPTA